LFKQLAANERLRQESLWEWESLGMGKPWGMGRLAMTRFSAKTFLTVAALSVLATAALAQAPAPWELKPDMGYAYDKEGKTFSYKMGTGNAGLLMKGAKKVPKGTLFFIGQNGQLYMRTGPYLEGDGKFMFGSN
jgi:hypothetical protein